MRVDFIANPDQADLYEVVDQESGEEIENIAWADDEAGSYGVFRVRGRTLADAKDADLRLLDKSGGFRVNEHKGDIQIVDLSENPLKAPLLALLDDPEVKAAVVRLTVDAVRLNPALLK